MDRFGLACVFDPTRDQLDSSAGPPISPRRVATTAGLPGPSTWQGFIHYALGELDEAIDHYERARHSFSDALNVARLAGDVKSEGEMSAWRAAPGHGRAGPRRRRPTRCCSRLVRPGAGVKRTHRQRSKPAVGSAYTLACKGAVLGDLGRFQSVQHASTKRSTRSMPATLQ